MSVSGQDNRTEVTTFTDVPFKATVAIDVAESEDNVELSTGILIGPHHVLTAGQSFVDNDPVGRLTGSQTLFTEARVTLAQDVLALADRNAGVESGINTQGDPFYPKNFDQTGASNDDIALVKLSQPLLPPDEVMGLTAFIDPAEAENFAITMAGFPINAPGTIIPPVPTANDGKALFEASGTVTATTADKLFYSNTVDTTGGQQGAGIWTTHDGNDAPTVMGVHTTGVLIPFSQNFLNSGTIITKELYDSLLDRMAEDDGTDNADDLPENTIVGSNRNPVFPDASSNNGDDEIQGSYRKEHILGLRGDDKLTGGGADDRLDGGGGLDEALYGDGVRQYKFRALPNEKNGFEFTIEHRGGDQSDGTDKLKDVEYARFANDFLVPLEASESNPRKLADGPEITSSTDIIGDEEDKAGTFSVRHGAHSFDGDLTYNLLIGSDVTAVFNFALIVDVSGSMGSFGPNGITLLAEATAAYQALIQSLVDSGVAATATFAVIPFQSTAQLIAPLSAEEAIEALDDLVAFGGTAFGPALEQGVTFFEDLPAGGTNIAYFLSDGVGFGASEILQDVAEVRAFGIGGASLTDLDIIDSDDAVLLSDPADLITEFETGGFDRDRIDRIEVTLDGQVVNTIDPDELSDSALGLTFEGEIEGLKVNRTAESDIAFKVIFNDGTSSAELTGKVSSGQEELIVERDDGTTDVVFSVDQKNFTSDFDEAVINGNLLDNKITVTGGENTLNGQRGDDLFVIKGGTTVVDGGAGSDTARFNQTLAEAGGLTRSGDVVRVGDEHSLIDVEFAEFSDQTIDLATLQPVQQISLSALAVQTTEGDDGNATATLTAELAEARDKDTTIAYATSDSSARAGTDYKAASGELVIAAGETSASLDIKIKGDTSIERDEVLNVTFTAPDDGLFTNRSKTIEASIGIKNDDARIGIDEDGSPPRFLGGDDLPHGLEIVLERMGDLSQRVVVDYEVKPVGLTSVGGDVVNAAFPSGQVVFKPGENQAKLEADLAGGAALAKGASSFSLALSSDAESVQLPEEPLLFEVSDQEQQPKRIRGSKDDDEIDGTTGRDQINAGRGDDIVRPGEGQDQINLGRGKDILEGMPEELNGDQLFGFTEDDSILLTGSRLGTEDVIAAGQPINVLGFDVDEDGQVDSSLFLQGDFDDGAFFVTPIATDLGFSTQITFEGFFPMLADGWELAENQVNGVANQAFLTGDGEREFFIQIVKDDDFFAAFDNTLGYYVVDQDGNIDDVGIIFENTNAAVAGREKSLGVIEEGEELGFFLIQDGFNHFDDLEGDFVFTNSRTGAQGNVDDGLDLDLSLDGELFKGATILHSFDTSLNPFGQEHVVSGVSQEDNALVLGFEDLVGQGSDRDFEDVVFQISSRDLNGDEFGVIADGATIMF